MQNNKTVLIITYFYYPIRLSVSYRVNIWTNYLSQLGWKPIILTRYWNRGEQDPMSESQVPVNENKGIDLQENPIIYRTSYRQHLRRVVEAGKLISKNKLGFRLLNLLLLNFCFYPDSYRGWFKYAYETGFAIIKKHSISAIFSIGPPWTDHWISSSLSKATGVPWVGDYRDKWTQRSPEKVRKRWLLNKGISRIIEKRICRNASALTHASGVWAQNLSRLIGKEVDTLIYGTDPKDFLGLTRAKTDNRAFTISYVGTLHFTQKLDIFFEGFKEFVSNNNVPAHSCRLKFIGCKEVSTYYQKYKSLEKYIDIVCYSPRMAAKKHMLQSDVLLLFLIDDDGWYPMKVFEYLETGNLILATPNDHGVIDDLMTRCRVGVALDTPKNIACWLTERWMEFLSKGYLSADIDKQVLKSMDRQKQVRKLAGILDLVVKDGQLTSPSRPSLAKGNGKNS